MKLYLSQEISKNSKINERNKRTASFAYQFMMSILPTIDVYAWPSSIFRNDERSHINSMKLQLITILSDVLLCTFKHDFCCKNLNNLFIKRNSDDTEINKKDSKANEIKLSHLKSLAKRAQSQSTKKDSSDKPKLHYFYGTFALICFGLIKWDQIKDNVKDLGDEERIVSYMESFRKWIALISKIPPTD